MESFIYWIERINELVWGPVLIILMIGTGLYLSFRLRWIQIRHIWLAHKLAFSKQKGDPGKGDISHFQALMTALAGTIGIGSITGVATAIATGGLGAIFWMWVAALFGMATKFAEAILAIRYRSLDENGEMSGGPMYYLDRGLKSKFLGVAFAVMAAIAALGTGNMIQANSVAAAFSEISTIHPIWIGAFLMIFTAIPLLGGIQSIGKVVTIIVPAMAVFYIVGASAVVLIHYEKVPDAFSMIVRTAFTGQAAVGGFLGSTMMLAIQLGMSRGVFSSEAGLGTSPIAAAAAKTDFPGRQALVSMSSVFITTGVVCTLTGLVIAITGVQGQMGANGAVLDGSALALKAFSQSIPFGSLFVTIALCFFGYSTMLGWAYYGEKSVKYLFGERSIIPYRILYILVIIPGAVLNLKVVWGIANIFNGLMAFPNLIGVLFLTGIVVKETELFEKLLQREREKKFSFQ